LDLTVQGATYYPNEPLTWLIRPFVTDHYRSFQAIICVALMSVFAYDCRKEVLARYDVGSLCDCDVDEFPLFAGRIVPLRSRIRACCGVR